MKKFSVILAIMAIVAVSCEKEQQIVSSKGIEKEFSVTIDDTKTTLNGVSILWADTDVITVKAATTGNEYDFTYVSGAGTKSAVFKGTIDAADASETVFYAVYPNIKNNEASDNVVKIGNTALGHTQIAVKDGFDPAFGIMAAKSTNGGAFSFKHGMAYLKFAIDQEGISKVKLSISGSGRIWGRPNIDVTLSSNTVQDKGKSDANYVELAPTSGSFAPGTYYIAVTVKPSSSIGDLTIEYTKAGITRSVTTSKMSSVKMSAGQLYDLGCPPISFAPVISATTPAKLAYDATSGSFTYTLANVPDGAVASAAITSGTWISNVAVSGNTVTFDCEANNGSNAEERSATITLSYNGASDVPVTITQGISGSVTSENYDWTFSKMSDDITGLGEEYIGSDGKFVNGKTFTISGLSYTTTSGTGTQSSWDSSKQCIRAGGTGSSSQRFFSFSISTSGTLTVSAASTGSNARAIYVNGEKHSSTTSASTTPVNFVFSVTQGTITVYPGDGDMRIYSIKYSSN